MLSVLFLEGFQAPIQILENIWLLYSCWRLSSVWLPTFPPQVAKTKQRIEEEKMQVQVVERTQQITLQEQEIIRKEMELEAKIKKPAEAEKYRLERLAEAQRWVLEYSSDESWTLIKKKNKYKWQNWI